MADSSCRPDDSAELLRRLTPEIGRHLTAMSANWRDGFEQLTRAIATVDPAIEAATFGAVSNDDSWYFIQLLGADSTLDDSDACVALVDSDATFMADRWTIVRLATGLTLGKGAHFVGQLWLEWCDNEQLPPFHLDAESWEGSMEGDGKTDFMLTCDGSDFGFSPREHELWGEAVPGVRPGIWLSVEEEHTGISIESDNRGCLWGKRAEAGMMFFGRPASETPNPAVHVLDLLSHDAMNGDFGIARVASDFLKPSELADILDSISAHDPNFDPDYVEVTCPDFDGCATELFASLQGD